MAGLQTLNPVTRDTAHPSAVVWINGRQAIVALTAGHGRISTSEIRRGSLPVSFFVAQVVRTIGDRERVVILGPSSIRLALERDYVAIFRRPDRLVDVEPAGPVTLKDLVDRLHTLAG